MDSLSQNSLDAGCFMVGNSQKEDPSRQHQLFNQLTALRTVLPEMEHNNNNDECDEGLVSPTLTPRKNANGFGAGYSLKAMAGSGDESKPEYSAQGQGSSESRGANRGGSGQRAGDGQGGDGTGEAGGAGSGGGSGGGGGGGGPGRHGEGGGGGDQPQEEEEEEETPSSAGSGYESGGVLAPVRPPSNGASSHGAFGHGDSSESEPQQHDITISEGEGGISDALTATVSDTEGHGQVIESRAVARARQEGVFLAPGGRGSPRRRGASPRGDVSSVASSLSSYSSSSSDDKTSDERSPRPQRKRPVGKKPSAEAKKSRQESTSESDNKTTTSSDTSAEKLHDTSGEKMDEEVSSSQQDLFEGREEEDWEKKMPERVVPSRTSTSVGAGGSSSSSSSTLRPASGSLQQWQQPMTGLSDDNGSGSVPGSTPTAEVFEGSQESLNLQISESQPPIEVSGSEVEASLHLQLSLTQGSAKRSTQKSTQLDPERASAPEPIVIPSSQEAEEGDLHLRFTPTQTAESQSIGVTEIVDRLDTPPQAESQPGSRVTRSRSSQKLSERSSSQTSKLARELSERLESPITSRRTRRAGVEPTLTLAMIDTQETLDPSEASAPLFTLDRPTVESAEDTESEPKSVFQQDRVRRQQLEKDQEMALQAPAEEGGDPFTFTSQEELKRQESWKILQQEQQARLSEHRSAAALVVEPSTSGHVAGDRESEEGEQDSEVIVMRQRKPAKRLEDQYEKETEEEERIEESIEEITVRDKSTLEGEDEEIVLLDEESEQYDFTAIKQSSGTKVEPPLLEDQEPDKQVAHLREHVSVASSQGFLQQTSFEQSGKSKTSQISGDCGTNSSDDGSKKDTKKSYSKGDKEEDMDVEDEEDDSDIIPPSEHGDISRVSSLRRSVSGSRESTQVHRAQDDPYQFTMSQSQRERDDLEIIKKERKGRGRQKEETASTDKTLSRPPDKSAVSQTPGNTSPANPQSGSRSHQFSADTQPASQITPTTSHNQPLVVRSSGGPTRDSFITTTITTRIMKLVRTVKQEFRGGVFVNIQDKETSEVLEEKTDGYVEELTDPSPSRSAQTLSSGDLADISSSMSRSDSKSSSLISPPLSIVPGSSSGSSGPSFGSFSKGAATSTQSIPRSGDSPISRTRGKSSSSSSSMEQKPTPLRSRSTFATKKRSKSKSQDVEEEPEMGEVQPEIETVVEPTGQDRVKATPADTSLELMSGVLIPEGSRPQEEVATERRDSDERRRSSSLFSEATDQKRVSESSAFSIPAGPPPRRSKASTSPESRCSRRTSSFYNEYYGLPRLSDLDQFKDIPRPDDPMRTSSSIGSASLFSAGSRPSNQSDRRSSGSLFSDRRSSVSVQMSGDEGVPEPALAVTSALSGQQEDESPPTPASNEDAQNVTVVPAREKRKKGDSPGASPPQAKQTKRSTSSSSLKQSEPLFATPSMPAPAAGRTSSEGKTSSSSMAQSASLFTSPEQPIEQESSKSKSSDSSLTVENMLRKTLEPRTEKGKEPEEMDIEEEEEMIPDTVEEQEEEKSGSKSAKRGRGRKTPGGRSAKKSGKGRGASTASPVPTPEEILRVIIPVPGEVMKTSDEDKSPVIPVMAEIAGQEDSPFKPPADYVLNPGTPVYAKWKDRCLYPGKIMSKEGQKYVVTFEDGNTMKVKLSDVIVCNLLPVGFDVMAEDGLDYVPAVVIGTSATGYEVELVEKKTKIRLERGQVMLSVKAAQEMLATVPVRSPIDTETIAPVTPAPSTPAAMDTSAPVTPAESETPSDGHSSARRGRNRLKKTTSSTAKESSKDRLSALKSERSGSRSRSGTPQRPETPSFTSATTVSEAISREASRIEVTFTESPEISAIASTSHGAEPFMSTPTTSVVEMGTPVLSMWKDKHFYPGHIASVEKDDKYLVKFEDGTKVKCKDTDIIPCDMLSEGQEVFAEKDDEASVLATVISSHSKGDDKYYTVQYKDDESIGKILRGQVCLNADQAESLARLGFIGPQTPSVGAADLSLDNLVEGKRSRKGTPLTRKTPGTTPRKSRGMEEKKSEYASGKKDSSGKGAVGVRSGVKRKLVGPQATSTPTPKRTKTAVKEEEVAIESTPGPSSHVLGVFESPQTAKRKTSSRAKSALFNTKGPLPPKGLFANMVFLITYVERSEEEKAYEKMLRRRTSSSDITDDGNEEEEETVPFDKDHLIEQIEAGGGRYVSKFDLDEVQDAEFCYLVSDHYHRTMKYFHCLAAPMPCVSHVWIRDSCRQGKLEDPKSYMLPAGLDIENDRLVEWSGADCPLRGVHVNVTHSDTNFVHQWTGLLETAGCTLLAKPPRKADPDKFCVVVSKLGLERNIVQRMQQLEVPVVSTEWIIQCLIRGIVVDTDGHPRYKHDYVPED